MLCLSKWVFYFYFYFFCLNCIFSFLATKQRVLEEMWERSQNQMWLERSQAGCALLQNQKTQNTRKTLHTYFTLYNHNDRLCHSNFAATTTVPSSLLSSNQTHLPSPQDVVVLPYPVLTVLVWSYPVSNLFRVPNGCAVMWAVGI